MKTYLYILLFVIIICPDTRRPSKNTIQCLIKELGDEKVKSLFSSFRKYHRSNGKAKFNEFIYNKKTDFKEVLEKCMNKKKRRVQGESTEGDQIALVDEMITAVKAKNGKEAVSKCKQLLKKDEFCKILVITMLEKYHEKNN